MFCLDCWTKVVGNFFKIMHFGEKKLYQKPLFWAKKKTEQIEYLGKLRFVNVVQNLWFDILLQPEHLAGL